MDSAGSPRLGATIEDGGARFRVWAPQPADVSLVLYGPRAETAVPMAREGEYRTVFVAGIRAGQRYRYRADGIDAPDPCSRSQPEGVHGPSEVVDPAFAWDDAAFVPPAREDLVIYEAHVGTLTAAGTFAAAALELPRLRALGVNAIELMPVVSFPGARNWGYDGAALFAPSAVYGGPEGLRRFVAAAHRNQLAVILDVVFNHFGPDGNYTGVFSDRYTTAKHRTPWGDAINFDDAGSADVRAFFRENLLHWVREYHVDGFRFDATHAIHDDSPVHILAELAAAVQGADPGGRTPYLIAESHENDVRYLQGPDKGGFGFDAVWADDFHHALRTMLHDEHEGYLAGFGGSAAELAETIAQGFLYEGQHDPGTGGARGTAARAQPWRQFVVCIQNHDQVGNRALGLRLNSTAGTSQFLAATLLLLLLPHTPLLFQGQEFLASTPFLYFTDHGEELGRRVTEGRRDEFAAFAAFRDTRTRRVIPDPQASATFDASKLRGGEATRPPGSLAVAFHRELLELRATDAVLRASRRGPGQRAGLCARPCGHSVLVEMENEAGRLAIVCNFGAATGVPLAGRWETVISSDEARFGGFGRSCTDAAGGVVVPAQTAVCLRPLA